LVFSTVSPKIHVERFVLADIVCAVAYGSAFGNRRGNLYLGGSSRIFVPYLKFKPVIISRPCHLKILKQNYLKFSHKEF
jgi:hypothetical protein